MHRRINITLPDETIELIAQVVGKGDSPEETLRDRSLFLNQVISNSHFEKKSEKILLFK